MTCSPPRRKVEPEGCLIGDEDISHILYDIGDTLHHLRVVQRVELADLAHLGNMAPRTLASIEQFDDDNIGLRNLYVIAGLLGVRLSDVLDYSERYILEGRSPWPHDGTNSPLVDAVFSTAPPRGSKAK